MENVRGTQGESSRSSDDLQDGVYVTITPTCEARLEAKKKRKSMGSWSKVFGGKARSRRSVAMSDPGGTDGKPCQCVKLIVNDCNSIHN